MVAGSNPARGANTNFSLCFLGVIDELRARNPRDPVTKRRKHAHHELLTSDVGHPHLDRQIISVTTLLSVSDDWSEFSRLFSKKFPPGPGDLFALPVPTK